MPLLRQRGGQPIPLRRPHLWQLVPQRLHLLQRLRRGERAGFLSLSAIICSLPNPAEMDSIASLPTGASADGPPSPASIAGSLTGSLVPLVYVDDFHRKHNRSASALVIMCHCLTHDDDDGTPAIDVSAAPWSLVDDEKICCSRFIGGVSVRDYSPLGYHVHL